MTSIILAVSNDPEECSIKSQCRKYLLLIKKKYWRIFFLAPDYLLYNAYGQLPKGVYTPWISFKRIMVEILTARCLARTAFSPSNNSSTVAANSLFHCAK